ncbi:hypothetical protein L1S35_07765 [Flavobacterium sp. AS60]|uniref:hypothetical protein n=1 Tax=Flavobacterium anseongense TaxID=2910677 RepID=UPI001F487671|nr:hypothetical protein [Flavobacterium sp. AS60]MCF6129565.1 hypothetical protein [Flavobacterium sp. AS60]
MELHNVLWIEDDEIIVEGILKNFSEDKEERGYNIMPSHFISQEELLNDKDFEISSISMKVVCVDNNLPGGVNGNEIIKLIRSYDANKIVPIIFYSSAKNENELRELLLETIDDISNVYFSHQDDLEDRLIMLLEQ